MLLIISGPQQFPSLALAAGRCALRLLSTGPVSSEAYGYRMSRRRHAGGRIWRSSSDPMACQLGRIAMLKSAYLTGTRSSWSCGCRCLRSRNCVSTLHWVLRMSAVACPVGPWLRIHGATGVRRITVLHVLLGWVGRVLSAVRRISWARGSN